MKFQWSIVLLVLCSGPAIFGFEPVIRKPTPEETEDFETRANGRSNVHRVKLDYAGKYDLLWEYDNETITFDVAVEAAGWIGLGFSPTSGMTNADIVFVWFGDDGKAHISDRHATANGYPQKDAQQDYTLLEASKDGVHFRAKFRRLRDTCDDAGDYRLTADNVRIIYAYSDDQPSDEEHFEKHLATNRGVKGVFLFEPPDVPIRLPPDTVVLEMLSNATHLPTDHHLMYWCQIFEMPRLNVHHLIRLDAAVEKGHEPYIHHVAMYQCSKNMSAFLERGERCFLGDGFNYSKMYECASKLIWFWNPGMKPSDFPDDVGFPMFESSMDSYIMLEVHYENLQLTPGIIDNSGIRLYLTPTLRPIEAGVMFLGTVEQAPNQIIPPGDPEFHFYAHFDNCLAQLPKNGTNFLYSMPHMHLYGKRARLHHYRNGTQLPDFAVDDNYDFYAQNFRLLDPPRLVLPGDELVLECIYNTSRANETIYGGFSTLDEMCDSIHLYYPRVAKGLVCLSYPDPHVYVPMFGGSVVDNTTVLLASNENVTLHEFVKEHLDWNRPGIREQYKEFVANGQYLQHFYYQPLKNSSDQSTTEDFPVELHVLTHNAYPKVTQPWIPETDERRCSAAVVEHREEVGGQNNTGKPSQSRTYEAGSGAKNTEKPVQLKERGSGTANRWSCILTVAALLMGWAF